MDTEHSKSRTLTHWNISVHLTFQLTFKFHSYCQVQSCFTLLTKQLFGPTWKNLCNTNQSLSEFMGKQLISLSCSHSSKLLLSSAEVKLNSLKAIFNLYFPGLFGLLAIKLLLLVFAYTAVTGWVHCVLDRRMNETEAYKMKNSFSVCKMNYFILATIKCRRGHI